MIEGSKGEGLGSRTYLEEIPGILGRSDVGLAIQCNPRYDSIQSARKRGEESDSLDECISVEVLDETRDASDTALSAARDGRSDGATLTLSVLLQDL